MGNNKVVRLRRVPLGSLYLALSERLHLRCLVQNEYRRIAQGTLAIVRRCFSPILRRIPRSQSKYRFPQVNDQLPGTSKLERITKLIVGCICLPKRRFSAIVASKRNGSCGTLPNWSATLKPNLAHVCSVQTQHLSQHHRSEESNLPEYSCRLQYAQQVLLRCRVAY